MIIGTHKETFIDAEDRGGEILFYFERRVNHAGGVSKPRGERIRPKNKQMRKSVTIRDELSGGHPGTPDSR